MAEANAEASEKCKQIANLDKIASDRYLEKLVVGADTLPDPYSIKAKSWEHNVSKWPSVLYPDIYNYLINYQGLYTKESLKAYKSLDGFNYYESGHVQEVLYYDVSKDSTACFVKTRVTPSQRVGDKPHEPWVCLDKKLGYVISAHCTCKAGLGEACSHIAALLFKMMMATLWGLNQESRTSVTCVWNQFYRKKVQPQPLDEISFDKPKHGHQKKRRLRVPNTADQDDIDEEEALRSLKRICPTACILTKADSDTDSASEDEDLPPLLHRFHEVEYQDMTKEELEDKCQQFVRDFSATTEQARNLECMTRAQHDSVLWQRQRKGRITATVAHDIMTLKPTTSKTNVLNKVMKYKDNDLSAVDAVQFGRQYESTAKLVYKKKMDVDHDQFNLVDCGLFVDTTFPLFAATPDGIRKCLCHGDGLLEIKCSYKHKDIEIRDINDSSFYLDQENQLLKKSHRYYTQIQFQMYVCEKTFCDFVVYTHKGIVCQTIPYDPDFVNQMIAKCTEFAINDLVSEIIQHKLQV